jgi:ATP-dependent RNA helicase RhlE
MSSYFQRGRRRRPQSSARPAANGPSGFAAASSGVTQPVRAPEFVPAPITPEIEEAMARSPFSALGLTAPFVRAILDEQYTVPSPVQSEVVPLVLAGRDVMAGAQTGTGKTAAFVLPILQLLQTAPPAGAGPRALILSPTRELAAQIAERVTAYGRYVRVRHAVIYGGVTQHRQEVALRDNPDLIVATPGRLLDLVGQKILRLDSITHFVLDEADRMLDMGFVHAVRRIVTMLPVRRQTLLFSATLAPTIETLARHMVVQPARVSIAPTITTAASVEQSVVFVSRSEKGRLLESLLRTEAATAERAIVFTRTKHGANRLCEQLDRAGIGSVALHGNKTQAARDRAINAFRAGTTRVLVATDIAARGIDVEGISLVVNYDLPNVAESYVHRVGRTGRAGASGRAISFCDSDERSLLTGIERYIRRRLPVRGEASEPSRTAASPPAR